MKSIFLLFFFLSLRILFSSLKIESESENIPTFAREGAEEMKR